MIIQNKQLLLIDDTWHAKPTFEHGSLFTWENASTYRGPVRLFLRIGGDHRSGDCAPTSGWKSTPQFPRFFETKVHKIRSPQPTIKDLHQICKVTSRSSDCLLPSLTRQSCSMQSRHSHVVCWWGKPLTRIAILLQLPSRWHQNASIEKSPTLLAWKHSRLTKSLPEYDRDSISLIR